MYLVLGDNHAMSADSRDFGFVPQENLRGAPDLIFWPPGPRFGFPNQPFYPLFNGPRAFVWFLAACCIIGGTIYWRRRNRLPLKDLGKE
jgi:signal peptidase I